MTKKTTQQFRGLCLRLDEQFDKDVREMAKAQGMSAAAFVIHCVTSQTGLIDTTPRRGVHGAIKAHVRAELATTQYKYMQVDPTVDGDITVGTEHKKWFTFGWVYKVPTDITFVLDLDNPELDRFIDVQHLLRDHPRAELVFMNVPDLVEAEAEQND